MRVIVWKKTGTVLSIPHVRIIEHVPGEYSYFLKSDDNVKAVRVLEYEVETMEVKVDP